MSKTKDFHLYRLYFKAGWHLSRGRTGLDRGDRLLHSDKLMSALFVSLLKLQDCGREFFDEIRISSAFPFMGSSVFFPVPAAGISWNQEGSLSDKKLKKIQFLEQSLFEDCLAGKALSLGKGQIREDLPEFAFATAGAAQRFKHAPFRHSVRNQVSIPAPPGDASAARGDAMPYAVERSLAGKRSGLYFLASFSDEKLWAPLLAAGLNILSDEGIGARRSTGLGSFSWRKDTLSLKVPESASFSLNLGLYAPQKGEIKKDILKKSAYRLVQRGGYTCHAARAKNWHHRKRAAFLFREASSFPGTPEGKLLDLAPQILEGLHPVWREGRPLFIPFQPSNASS